MLSEKVASGMELSPVVRRAHAEVLSLGQMTSLSHGSARDEPFKSGPLVLPKIDFAPAETPELETCKVSGQKLSCHTVALRGVDVETPSPEDKVEKLTELRSFKAPKLQAFEVRYCVTTAQLKALLRIRNAWHLYDLCLGVLLAPTALILALYEHHNCA